MNEDTSWLDEDASWLDEPALTAAELETLDPKPPELPPRNLGQIIPLIPQKVPPSAPPAPPEPPRPEAPPLPRMLAIPEKDRLTSRQQRAEFAAAWRKLQPRQRQYIEALGECRWNNSAALRTLKKTGATLSEKTVRRWLHQDDVFVFVYSCVKSYARSLVVDKDALILQAGRIHEKAMKPKPVLYKGEDTGFREQNLDTALRATELLMKTQRMLGNDQEQQSQGNGPPLVIQIVQGENKVVDVTHGVVIDMPVPDAS